MTNKTKEAVTTNVIPRQEVNTVINQQTADF